MEKPSTFTALKFFNKFLDKNPEMTNPALCRTNLTWCFSRFKTAVIGLYLRWWHGLAKVGYIPCCSPCFSAVYYLNCRNETTGMWAWPTDASWSIKSAYLYSKSYMYELHFIQRCIWHHNIFNNSQTMEFFWHPLFLLPYIGNLLASSLRSFASWQCNNRLTCGPALTNLII